MSPHLIKSSRVLRAFHRGPRSPATFVLVGLAFASTCFGADASLWLIRQNFERPTEVTAYYPPQPGARFVIVEGMFGGWSQGGGQVTLLYGQGIGHQASGGLHLEVVKAAPTQGYYALNAQPFVFPTTSSELIGARVKSLFLEFRAKIPTGAKVEVQLKFQGASDFKDRYYPGRLMLGTITGTGDYQTYVLRGVDVAPGDEVAFVRLAKDLIANGAKLDFSLSWHLHAGAWNVSDGLGLDDVNFGFAE